MHMFFKNKYSENFELDYNTYEMGLKEKIALIFLASIVLGIVGFIFYRQRLVMIGLMCSFSLLAPEYIKKKKIKLQKN